MELPSFQQEIRTPSYFDSLRDRKKIEKRSSYFLLIGSDRENKNVLNAVLGYINFFKGSDVLTPDLVIVGQFSSPYIKKLKDLFYNAGINKAEILGFATALEYTNLMMGAQGVVFLSLYEGFGIPVLEAIAESKPVLVSKGTICQEIAGPMGIAVDRRKLEEIVDGYEQLAGFLCYDHLATLSHLDKYIDTEAGARILEEFLLQKSTKALLV